MRRAVAITAFWKLLEHACRMRYAVTVCTLLYGCVFIRMTGGTGKVVVFGCICLKQDHRVFVASAAIVRRDFWPVSDDERHMNRMAGLAGLKVHVPCVFFMAIHTNRDLPVFRVALVASQIRVSTGMILYFLTLLRMAGEARSGEFAF